jgi:hypothetical protein
MLLREIMRFGFRGWNNKELYDLYASPNIICVIKSRRMIGGSCGTFGRRDKCVQGFGGGTGTRDISWKTHV